jgi:predicted nucleic acid-binding protein
VTALVDTNVIVYRFDSRDPRKQDIAASLLREGIRTDTLRLCHQSIVEFVAACTRQLPGGSLLAPDVARREAEELLSLFGVLYPNEAVLHGASRGCGVPAFLV